MTIELYPHQIAAIQKLETGKVLYGGVGSGKSRTALAYYYTRVCGGTLKVNGEGEMSPMEHPRDLLIITTAQKRDKKEWEGECAAFAISRTPDESYNGVTLIIDSWNNIKKYTDVKDMFVIFDEQRLVGSGVWVKSFYQIAKNNEWVLLSATPGDTWSDYIPLFVANGYYKNKTEFEREHVIYKRFAHFPQIDRYVGTKRLERHREELLIHMPYSRHTVRHRHLISVQYDLELTKRVTKDRWNPFEDCPIENAGVLCYTLRKVTNSSPERGEKVEQICREHPRVIVFYNFNYELEILRSLHSQEGTVVAEWNGHKHEPVPDAERWIYLVQYTAGSEGWNCVSTNVMVFYSLNYSYRVMEQAEGRIDRLNTPFTDLHYYTIRSAAPIDVAILRAVRQKEKFNEQKFAGGYDKRQRKDSEALSSA